MHRNPLRRHCAFLFAAAGLSGLAAADDLESVTVTAKRLEEQLPQILATQGIRVDTISAAAIAKGGYIDVAGVLQSLAPGLTVSPRNGPFDYVDVSLQGSRTADVLWLVDGVRINNRLYGFTTPLDTLPAAMVDQIQILEGGESLFYGTQSAAGAINVITRAFSETPDGQVSLGGDTNRSAHWDGYYRDSIGPHHFVAYLDVDLSSGFQPFRSQDYQSSGTDRHRDYHLYTGGAKYAFDFSDTLRLSAAYQHTTGKVDFAEPFLTNTAFNERDEDILSGKLDYTPSDRFQLFGKAYYHRWASHYTEFDNTASAGVLAVEDDHDYWGFSDRGVNLMSKFRLESLFEEVVGYDYQNYNGRDAVLVIGQHSENVSAVFGQIATSPSLIDHTVIAAGVRFNDPSVGQSATVWSLSGKHDFTADLFIRALVGTSFRLPTAEELFANDPEDERGDPNLKPEQSKNLNVSLGGFLDDQRFKWELIGFARDITNLIDYGGFDSATDQALFANVPGTVRVRGGELDLTGKCGDFSTELSYTYSHSVQEGNLQIDAVPVQQAKLAVDYQPAAQPFGLTATALYVGREFRSGMWDGRDAYGDYPVFDLAGRYYLDQARRQTLSVRLENVLDRRYASAIGSGVRDADGSGYTYWDLGPPRTLEARYTYHF